MTDNSKELDTIVAEALIKHRAGDVAAAVSAYDSVLAQDPNHAEALHLKGIISGQQGRPDEALELLDQAVSIAPNDPRILANRATLRLERNDVAGSIADYNQALEQSPEDANLHFNTAGALAAAGRLDEAMSHLEQASKIEPSHARALANLGNLYRQTGRTKESREALERAIEVAPGDPQVQHSLGVTLADGRDYDAAAARFRRALELDKGFIRTAVQLFYANLYACDWRDREKLIANFDRLIDSNSAAVSELSPLIALYVPETQARLNAVGNARAATLVVSESPSLSPQAKEKLHVAYFSGDLGQHPVGHLTVDLFHRHNREKFKVSAILPTAPDESDVHKQVVEGVDHVEDVSRLSAADAAARIRELEVDILVDLGGFTRGARPEILAERAAPLQIGWLGYCGSSGGLNDVLLADDVVLPPESVSTFAEGIAYLPGSFMPLNNIDRPSAADDARADHSLPETGFVFCAFNTPTKIDPETFVAWMEILKQVEGSVLWLREHVPTTTRNLQKAAQIHGVDPDRLVFAPSVANMADHLARHRHADLFLDSFVYGAHSTAADAIAMGLPVLTRAGATMPARVGASLCRAYGLDDLVTDTTEGYVWTAAELAHDASLLAARKDALSASLETVRDSGLFLQKLESAYRQIWDAGIAGTIVSGRAVQIHVDTE